MNLMAAKLVIGFLFATFEPAYGHEAEFSRQVVPPERSMFNACLSTPALYGVVQPGTDTAQKRVCAEFVSKKFNVDFDYLTESVKK